MTPPPAFRHRLFWWATWCVWFATLFVLSSIAGVPREPHPIEFSDKVLHAIYFAAGGGALLLALSVGGGDRPSPWILLLACVGMAAAVGWFDEWHQSFTPGRSGNDLGDWLADLVGGALGWASGLLARGWITRGAACPPRVAR